MTLTISDPEEQAAERAWRNFRTGNSIDALGVGLNASIGPWTSSDGPAGPLLSTEITGADAAAAVRRFAVAGTVTFSRDGHRQIPQLDVAQPGRVACVWQSGGVWVELWCTEQPTPTASSDVEPPARTTGLRAVLAPGGRLPFTRGRRVPSQGAS